MICFIVPPHIEDEIEKNGTDEDRRRLADSKRTSLLIREQRLTPDPDVSAGPGLDRNVHNAQNGYLLPGPLVRAEGSAPSGDGATDEAYEFSGASYDLFKDEYGRDSIDGAGMTLISTIRFRVGYDNAFWNGRQMVYGDGDTDQIDPATRIFNRFTILDICGHELTHGVVQHTAKLPYENQTGALNEHFADVFGSLVKQRSRGEDAATANWIIGEGLFTSRINSTLGGIRSMKAPGTAYDDPLVGKDPQPAHMDDFYTGTADHGGVHINSGIPNHAFYLFAIALGGNAWQEAGQIWYRTLTELPSTAQFSDMAQKTVDVAGTLFTAGSTQQRLLGEAWRSVGIETTAPAPLPTPEEPTPTPDDPPSDESHCKRIWNKAKSIVSV